MAQPSLQGAWYHGGEDARRGPLALADLQAMVKSGTLGPETLVFTDGMLDWTAIDRLPVLFGLRPPSGAAPGTTALALPVRSSGLAIAGGCLGLSAFLPPCAPLAIGFSIAGALDLRRRPDRQGWGWVVAGLTLGSTFTLLWGWLLFLILSR